MVPHRARRFCVWGSGQSGRPVGRQRPDHLGTPIAGSALRSVWHRGREQPCGHPFPKLDGSSRGRPHPPSPHGGGSHIAAGQEPIPRQHRAAGQEPIPRQHPPSPHGGGFHIAAVLPSLGSLSSLSSLGSLSLPSGTACPVVLPAAARPRVCSRFAQAGRQGVHFANA